VKALAKVAAPQPPLIHARALTYAGHAHSGWSGHGRRKYQEPKLPDGQVRLVCGRGLDDVHKAATGTENQFPWVALKSIRARDARFVTCPECARILREAYYRYAPPPPPEPTTELGRVRRTSVELGGFTVAQIQQYGAAKKQLAQAMQRWGAQHPEEAVELEFPPHSRIVAHLAALPPDCMLNDAARELVAYCTREAPAGTVLMFRSLVLGEPEPLLTGGT